MTTYTDYRYHFPLAGLALAASAFTALRAAGVLAADALPANMLGDPILLNGVEVARGRQGRAAMSYTDETTGETVNVPAAGDPAMVYVHIRSETGPSDLPQGFDPAAYGLIATTSAESSAVLGVWA